MSLSSKKCCVPGCMDSGDMHYPLHLFPNPEKDKQRFNTWVMAIGGDIDGMDGDDIYKLRRVCHAHFEQKFCCRYNRLSNIALPTLKLSGLRSQVTIAERRPLQELQNFTETNLPSTSQVSKHPLVGLSQPLRTRQPTNLPSSETNLPSTSSVSKHPLRLTGLDPPLRKRQPTNISSSEGYAKRVVPRTLKTFTTSEHKLYNQLRRAKANVSKLKSKAKKQAASLKAAKKLITNPAFMEAVEKLPNTAKILTLLQFRELKKLGKGRRFTLEEKIVGLSILKQSPKCYRFLRKIFILPTAQTLTKLLNQADVKPGINKKIFSQLKKATEKLNENEKLCLLLFDEMSLKANISYNERKDSVTGCVTDGCETIAEYADHAQVFMVRGLLKNYKQAVCYTFSAAATSEPKNNTFIVDKQEIIPLFDPPHLIKCIRNNLITKNLTYSLNDHQIRTGKWEHIQMLHRENPGYKGIRLMPKLTDGHVIPSKISKMKVKYATQVFSQTVASNMGYLADKGILPKDCQETADILLFFDELFDSVNGSYLNKSKLAKPLLGPVKPISVHHRIWTKALKVLKTMKFVNRNSGKAERVPTIDNWVWTLEGIRYLLKKIKSDYNVTSVWMRHLNQDPLENFFGAIRSHGCRNTNPTPEKFESAYTSLLINNISSVHAPGANCENDFCDILNTLIITDCQANATSNLECIPDVHIIEIKNNNDPRVIAPLRYVSGYFANHSKKRIFKNCSICCQDIISDGDGDENEYINRREYAGKHWLASPTEPFLDCMSAVQDIINDVLKKNLFCSSIKELTKTIIFCHISNKFDFLNCPIHKNLVIDHLLQVTCRFYIYNYCKHINNILKGKREPYDDEDSYQAKAKKYFFKCYKRTNK